MKLTGYYIEGALGIGNPTTIVNRGSAGNLVLVTEDAGNLVVPPGKTALVYAWHGRLYRNRPTRMRRAWVWLKGWWR